MGFAACGIYAVFIMTAYLHGNPFWLTGSLYAGPDKSSDTFWLSKFIPCGPGQGVWPVWYLLPSLFLLFLRLGKPDECAGIVSFLCSEDASYITGETVVVGGGIPSRLWVPGENSPGQRLGSNSRVLFQHSSISHSRLCLIYCSPYTLPHPQNQFCPVKRSSLLSGQGVVL